MKEWDLKPVHRVALATADWSRRGGYEAASALLRGARGPLPDALFAFNDSLAIGAMHALREHGIAVPDQIAVAGIDDLDESSFFDPPLTSLAPDLDDIAETALTALTLQIEGRAGRAKYRRKVTSFELKVRASTTRKINDAP